MHFIGCVNIGETYPTVAGSRKDWEPLDKTKQDQEWSLNVQEREFYPVVMIIPICTTLKENSSSSTYFSIDPQDPLHIWSIFVAYLT